MKIELFNLKGAKDRLGTELLSGLLVAVIALPLALAFGVSAFGPLGPAYGALGAVAGLTGAALTGLIASLFGGCAPQVTGPTGPMSVVARSTLAGLLASPLLENLPEDQKVAGVLWFFGLSVILGGLVQWGLAWSRLGVLVRSLPYPVVAGFMNGVSLLILWGQLKPFLGWPAETPWPELIAGPWPPAVLIGLAASLTTAVIIWFLPRLTKAIPASFAGLLAGTGVYFALAAAFLPSLLDLSANSQVVGPIPSALPLPTLLLDSPRWFALLANPDLWLLLLQQAVVLGLLGSIDTLLTSVIADLRTRTRHDSSRELFGQGLGNLIAGLFGALPGAGATVRTLVNIDSGGRTGLSGAVHGLILLAILLLLGPLAQGIPLPVLGAILMVMAVRMVDIWSLELTRKRSAWSDSLVLWLVTLVTVLVDLIIAVGVGLLLAALLYVRRQTAQGARLTFTDLAHRPSRTLRHRAAARWLSEQGRAVRVIRLDGSLFFGSADDHVGRMERASRGVKGVVLDLEGLDSLDLSGGRMLLDLATRFSEEGKQLYWGGWNPESRNGRFLTDLGLLQVLPADRLFPDADQALEAAEQDLLSETPGAPASPKQIADLDFWSGLSPEEQTDLGRLITEKSLKDGELLFRQGDADRSLYFVLAGSIEVRDEAGKRVTAYAPGQHLGLIAWLEGSAKNYTGCARGKVRVAVLPEEPLEALWQKRPELGLKLVKAWSAQLAGRVRRSALESQRLTSPL